MLWGVNCGEAPYPGGYDWYPCQHERFIQQVDVVVVVTKNINNADLTCWINRYACILLSLVNKKLQDNGQWINNVTYCGGRHDKCDTNIIVTIANVSMPVPGVSLDLQLRRFHFNIDAGGTPRLCWRTSCTSVRRLATCFLSPSWLCLHDVVSTLGVTYFYQHILMTQCQTRLKYELNIRCGRLPVLDYAGGIVISRHRTAKDMPAKVRL